MRLMNQELLSTSWARWKLSCYSLTLCSLVRFGFRECGTQYIYSDMQLSKYQDLGHCIPPFFVPLQFRYP